MKRKILLVLIVITMLISLSATALAKDYHKSYYVTKSWPCYAKDVFDIETRNGKIVDCDPYQVKRDIRPFISINKGGIKVYKKYSSYWIVRSSWSISMGGKEIGYDIVTTTIYYKVYNTGKVRVLKRIIE